ncbi:hypothetical protein KA977_15745, partial [Candidatus Dependentiae bacterium]|nr:hypothetical protein [Candidatus Dependentiae bacterium]
MIKKIIFILYTIILFGNIIDAGDLTDYYFKTKDKIGNELKNSLHNIIKKHKVVSYNSLWIHYKKTDARENGEPYCIYT